MGEAQRTGCPAPILEQDRSKAIHAAALELACALNAASRPGLRFEVRVTSRNYRRIEDVLDAQVYNVEVDVVQTTRVM
ncbi:hypothetical protein FVQ98_15530 [Ottowia sp. GY511]|uniref:Uncharacterized protein n=1 Tax=Ottowia flava TaxID=2675430 RepID=A0ABW4KNG2_9BURK|nr:hypothetical protein [Ottowia sp. GY511]TXK24846.1 hypothetical protein FVQ98_15530 [Ottowia sp. GY511]